MGGSEIGWERRADGRSVRVLRDGASGRKWRVWQADAAHVPGARGGTCLIFDGGDVIRRVWEVPDDWAAMTPPALLALGERAPGHRRDAGRAESQPALGALGLTDSATTTS